MSTQPPTPTATIAVPASDSPNPPQAAEVCIDGHTSLTFTTCTVAPATLPTTGATTLPLAGVGTVAILAGIALHALHARALRRT